MKFFETVKSVDHLSKVLDTQALSPVPPNHTLIITDVEGSTRAIEEGRYKDVNVAGGLAVMAVCNAYKDMQFPFVFGGDGVTMLVENDVVNHLRDVLFDTREKITAFYDLHLRIGFVPIQDLLDATAELFITKLKVSQFYSQAILYGNGIELAENWVKTPNSKYLVTKKTDPDVEADFSGFTCRWKDIDSPKELTIALIVKLNNAEKFQNFLSQIYQIIGSDHHPLTLKNLQISSVGIHHEVQSRAGVHAPFKSFITKLKIRLEMFITKLVILFRLPFKFGYYKIKDIKNYNIISSDYQKYDGTLKMIIAIKSSDFDKLKSFLEDEFKRSQLYYGIHVSNRAMLTCLLHVDSEREVHFVDAADGGYALAAKSMKKQMQGHN